MVRTPEQYFEDQDFAAPEPVKEGNITGAEHAFLQKYVGVENAEALGISFNELEAATALQLSYQIPMEEELKTFEHLQMIFFEVCGQVYTIPIEAVQEVIRFTPPMQLPLTPDFMAGVVNLRGRVTPLLHLDQLLGYCGGNTTKLQDKFIIVCQRKGMQFGMIIDKVRNMFIVKQKEISWNVEFEIGANVQCICGILDHDKKIFGIISTDKIVNHVLQSRG